MTGVWCVNCGENEALDEFTLRFHLDERPNKDLGLRLCEPCLTDILTEEWIECAGDRCAVYVEAVR